MATLGGQELNVISVEKETSSERVVRLSDGLVFQSKYDICRNVTTNTLTSSDGEVLYTLDVPGNGNFVREEMDAFMQIMSSPAPVDVTRDDAILRAGSAYDAGM